MSKFKGTKGRWTAITKNYYQEVNSNINDGTKMHASIFLYKGFNEKDKIDDFSLSDESKANALLISKAPELLSMLDDILPIISSLEGCEKTTNEIKKLIKEATELS